MGLMINCPHCKSVKYVSYDSDIIVCDVCGKIFTLSKVFENKNYNI